MKKKLEKNIKKNLKSPLIIVGIIFLLVGVILGFFVYSSIKVEGETKVELHGLAIVEVPKNATYFEEGYTFIIDGVDYTNAVVVSGNVDTTLEGTYIITYTLYDGVNNIVLSRVVNVIGGV